jgi:hypothetical protein
MDNSLRSSKRAGSVAEETLPQAARVSARPEPPIPAHRRKAARAALRRAAHKGLWIGYGRIDRAALYERGW